MDSKKYFFLAWTEEQLNCDAAALLLYLSSFCFFSGGRACIAVCRNHQQNSAPTEEALAFCS